MTDATDATSPYTAEDRARWRQLLLKKGGEISSKLQEILNNKDARLEDFSLWANDEPQETPERRLRRFFDHLMARMRAVDHPRFGFDPKTGAFASVTALDETPWLDLEP